MALKDTWVDLENAIEGLPDSGSNVNATPINDIAHAVIDIEDKDYDSQIEEKADKATTMAGYGITDAYTKTEADTLLSAKADAATTLSGYGITDAFTKDEMTTALSSKADTFYVDTKLETKLQESTLLKSTVNTPLWENQPTTTDDITGLDVTDFYYVTLNDAGGSALPAGKFMLKYSFASGSTVYSPVFSLTDLDTGSTILVENYPVEINAEGKFRDAGVSGVQFDFNEASGFTNGWKLNNATGKIRITTQGQYIQRLANGYYTPVFWAKNNVSSYHSSHATVLQNASTKQIIPYAALGIGSYHINQFFDDTMLERNGVNQFVVRRLSTLRYQLVTGSSYAISSHSVFGYGTSLSDGNYLESVRIQPASSYNYGMLRNGTTIHVTEVK